MEKLHQLIEADCFLKDVRKILYAWWYAYATNSYYWVRHKSDTRFNEKWLEDWMAVQLSQFFEWEKKMYGKATIRLFDNVDLTTIKPECDECDWYGNVEWSYWNYTKDDTCPKCDWRHGSWYNPLDYMYFETPEWQYISWKQLYAVISVLWEIEYWVCAKYFYFTAWDYDWIINYTPNDIKSVSNVKIIKLNTEII